MKTINEGIVFSNDIKTILDGNNALDFNYQGNGLILPSQNTISYIRESFFKETKNIFNNRVTIITEEQMLEGLNSSLSDVYMVYPHCLSR